MNAGITAYGFNFIYEFENGSFGELCTKIKDKYFKSDLVIPEHATLKYILPTVVYDNAGRKMSLKFEQVLENSIEQPKIRVSCNAHFGERQLPELTPLIQSYTEIQTQFQSYIESILA